MVAAMGGALCSSLVATFQPERNPQMSPEACEVLMGAIVPRLKAAVPKCVRLVGAEDHEELVQDGIAIAARMLHLSEVAGKMAPPSSVAYYTLQHLKSGRRSTGNSRADVMATGTQLDLSSSVLSLEEEVGFDEELGEPIVLGEMLACRGEDPAMAGGRNVDWEQFLGTHDHRYRVIVSSIAKGEKPGEMAKALGIEYHQFQYVR